MSEQENIEDKQQEELSEAAIRQQHEQETNLQKILHIQSMFEDWYIDYASYTILERAVPYIYDGLKPVQRRILHAMKEKEDGRYNKVANIIGHTMQYHPHGDASIGDALVNLGQKNLLIDTQGNWGNILTGDVAAAPRYIEARLTKFALEVVFNPKTTAWKSSYDGRNKEPIFLPVKFPLLLAQGAEGIATTLSSKILPHNFNELVDASIAVLENKDFTIYPDFQTGGYADISNYNNGKQGGRVIVRAKIVQVDKKTLAITEIPAETTTDSLIESISKAVERSKINLKKIFDNTATTANIVLHLAPNTSPDQTIDALYAFTDCQKSISPNACVIENNKPLFTDVKYILRQNTFNTVELLRKELEILLSELEDQWHWISLEKIFFEQKIYKELEKDKESFDSQIDGIERAFDPYRAMFKQKITRDDVLKLTEKPVRKISKFDIKKAEEQLQNIETDIDEVNNHLQHLIDYAINYFKQIKKKYGTGRERKTEIRSFDKISVPAVAVANQKLYADFENGFAGIGLKKTEAQFVCDCSDMDEIIVFRKDGTFVVSKVADKQFVGKGIIHIDVFSRNDDRTVYNVVYSNGKNGPAFVKRFSIGGITRDKEYVITQGKEGSQILHFTANKNGEAETIRVNLFPKSNLRKKSFDFDFSTLAIKGRSARGNILSKNSVKDVRILKEGVSTLSALGVWYDRTVNRLNTEGRGEKLGDFLGDDKIIAYYLSGYYKITGFDISTHFDDDLLYIEKLNSQKPITAVYLDGEKKKYFLKRALPEISDKKIELVFTDQKQECKLLSINYLPQIEIVYYLKDKKNKLTEIINAAEFVDIMRIKAKGKRIPFDNILSVKELEPLPYTPPQTENNSPDDTVLLSENTQQEDENWEDFSIENGVQGSLF